MDGTNEWCKMGVVKYTQLGKTGMEQHWVNLIVDMIFFFFLDSE